MNNSMYKTLIMQDNYDSNNVPFSPKITQIDSVTGCLTVITEQTIDELQGLEILSPTNLIQVYNESDLIRSSNRYLVLPEKGQIKFSPNLKDQQILFNFYGKSAIFIADCRIYTKMDNSGTPIEFLSDILRDAQANLDFLKKTTDLVALDVTMKADIENGQNMADIIENDIVIANQTDDKLNGTIATANTTNNTLNTTNNTAKNTNATLIATNTTATNTNITLNNTINTANIAKTNLDNSTTTANNTRTALDTSNTTALATKSALETTTTNANIAKANLQATIDASDISGMQANITGIMNGTKDITYNNLSTTDKTVDGALNELFAHIGVIANLTTVDKTSLLNAINELNTAGKVDWFARNTPPTGWLKCNGATISRTTYARLFSAIGTTFGAGDGSTTFVIPDLRGYVIRGWDDGRGIDTGRVFGSYQADDFKSHTHGQNVTAEVAGGSGTRTDFIKDFSGASAYPQGISTNATGGTETRMKNIALLACIKY